MLIALSTRTRLALCQYTWPQCVHSSENHLNQKPLQKSPQWSSASGVYVRKRHERSEVTITTPLRQQSTHVNILLSLAMTMGSTSRKPSQDVSKRSREQIQPTTISTHLKIKIRLHFSDLARLRRRPSKERQYTMWIGTRVTEDKKVFQFRL